MTISSLYLGIMGKAFTELVEIMWRASAVWAETFGAKIDTAQTDKDMDNDGFYC